VFGCGTHHVRSVDGATHEVIAGGRKRHLVYGAPLQSAVHHAASESLALAQHDARAGSGNAGGRVGWARLGCSIDGAVAERVADDSEVPGAGVNSARRGLGRARDGRSARANAELLERLRRGSGDRRRVAAARDAEGQQEAWGDVWGVRGRSQAAGTRVRMSQRALPARKRRWDSCVFAADETLLEPQGCASAIGVGVRQAIGRRVVVWIAKVARMSLRVGVRQAIGRRVVVWIAKVTDVTIRLTHAGGKPVHWCGVGDVAGVRRRKGTEVDNWRAEVRPLRGRPSRRRGKRCTGLRKPGALCKFGLSPT